MVVNTARDVDGTVECPECGEECGESTLQVLSGRDNAYVRGGTGGVWAYVGVEHTECGNEFEIGGPVGVTGENA